MSAPRLISRYEIKGLIARGGMGEVYLARDPNTNRLVVVKLLSATLDSSDLRERFEREARTLASLNHPNVVHIYDYGDVDDTPFIVIEYVRGETLAEKIRRRAPMTVAHKLKLMAELCAGLAHAHAAGIIHRDVKPGNLMVDQDDRLKLLDFGIARVGDSNLTRFGVLASQLVMQIGTPGYMAPEQIQGGEIDGRADIFGVGAVCYALLAYREPFPGKDPDEIERSVMSAPPTPLSSLVAQLDPEVDAIVSRALAKARDKRFPDAATMGEALERCRHRIGQSEAPLPARREPPPQPGGKPASPAESAYRRASQLYEEGAREPARRFAIEALAEDPNHAAAKALLTRIQSDRKPEAAAPQRPGTVAARTVVPSATSGDEDPTVPTVHIPAVRRPEPPSDPPQTILLKPGSWPMPMPPGGSDQTVLIPPGYRPSPPANVPAPSSGRRSTPEWSDPTRTRAPERPAADRSAPLDPAALLGAPPAPTPKTTFPHGDETVLLPRASIPRETTPKAPTTPPLRKDPAPPPRKESARQPAQRSGIAGFQAWLASLTARSKSPSKPQAPRKSPGTARTSQPWLQQYGLSIAIAAGLVVFIAVGVLVALRLSGVWGGSSYLLTISKPQNGTISGGGLNCGSRGSDCSGSLANGETVEFTFEADDGFAFGGYTGDCAPAGRMLMSGPRSCGATFTAVTTPSGPTQWTLTIIKPTGGTLIAAGGIECGTMGSKCTTDVLDGVPVTVFARADPDFAFLSFTEGCAPSGNMMMTAPRTCGATFAPRGSGGPTVYNPQPKPQPPGPIARGRGPEPPPANPPPQAPGPGPGPGPAPGTTKPEVVVQAPDKPADPVVTDNDHAKNTEIPDLLMKYCPALESLNPTRVQEIFPNANVAELRKQFNGYKSLTCEMAKEREFIQLDGTKGAAHVRVGIKQTIQMRSGGAPQELETIADMTLSRPEARTTWRIVKLLHRPKPKP